MKFLWSLLVISILWSLWVVSPCFAGGFHLEYRAGVNLPAHEAVAGGEVARWMLEIVPGFSTKNFRLNLALRSWGTSPWMTPEERGHGWDKYQNSDWGADHWRTAMTLKGEVGPDKLHLFTEYYFPFDRHNWGGHGMENNYYLIVGVGGRL